MAEVREMVENPQVTADDIQKNYERVLKLMKEVAGPFINENYRYMNGLGSTGWNSTCTNKVIETILKKWGIDEDIYSITGEEKDTTFISGLILIEDLLKNFSVNEILLMFYRTFDLLSYDDLMSDYSEEIQEQLYAELSNKLRRFIMGMMNKFNIDKSILKLLPDFHNARYTSEDQVRILWFNHCTHINVMVRYGNLYSEEFTDYLIDHMVKKMKSVKTDKERNDILLMIHTLMESRRFMPMSEMFKKKHAEIIDKAEKRVISNCYSLKEIFSDYI